MLSTLFAPSTGGGVGIPSKLLNSYFTAASLCYIDADESGLKFSCFLFPLYAFNSFVGADVLPFSCSHADCLMSN